MASKKLFFDDVARISVEPVDKMVGLPARALWRCVYLGVYDRLWPR